MPQEVTSFVTVLFNSFPCGIDVREKKKLEKRKEKKN